MFWSRLLSMPLVATILLSAAPPIWPASYYRLDEVTADPILFTAAAGGGVHVYSGPDLHPGTGLNDANLSNLDWKHVTLTGADLSSANLTAANLSHVNLLGVAFYDASTLFDEACNQAWSSTCPHFDPIAAGWIRVGAPVPALSPQGLFALAAQLMGNFRLAKPRRSHRGESSPRLESGLVSPTPPG